ncbi:unnamed protein product [Urochloa humidicola]
MSFGLKNADATYQRAIQSYLDKQIGRNIEAYVDDVVIKSKTSEHFISGLEKIMFPVLNNAAEYEAALHGLRLAVSLGIKRLMVRGDSALVVNQVNKDWSRTSEKMDAYCEEIHKIEGKFYGIEFHHVLRDYNKAADALAKMGSTREEVPPSAFIQDLVNPSVKQNPDGTAVEAPRGEGPAEALVAYEAADWRMELADYLADGTLPPED